MMDESIACSQGLVPLTPRVVIHHQNAKWAHTKKRCTLKKEILIFGLVKNGPKWSQKSYDYIEKIANVTKNA